MKYIETDTLREFVNTDEVRKIDVSPDGGGATLLLRNGAKVRTDESDAMELALSSTYIPAQPGWSIQFHDKIGVVSAVGSEEPHPIIGWALPSGMPIVPKFGIVFVGGANPPTLIRPDGKRLRWNKGELCWEWEVAG